VVTPPEPSGAAKADRGPDLPDVMAMKTARRGIKTAVAVNAL